MYLCIHANEAIRLPIIETSLELNRASYGAFLQN